MKSGWSGELKIKYIYSMELSEEIVQEIANKIAECESIEEIKFTLQDTILKLEQLELQVMLVGYDMPKALHILNPEKYGIKR